MIAGNSVKIVRMVRPAPTKTEMKSVGKTGTVRKISRGGMLLVAYGENKKWFFEDELEVENGTKNYHLAG